MEPADASEPLRLAVFDIGGTLHLWEWTQDKFIWSSIGTLQNALPFPSANVSEYQFAYDPQNKFVIIRRGTFPSLLKTLTCVCVYQQTELFVGLLLLVESSSVISSLICLFLSTNHDCVSASHVLGH